jgi:branched-chain amino acid transport system ATP-binding protein
MERGRMSPPGRPKGEYRRAQPEGTPVSTGARLEVQALEAAYGASQVLFGVSLTVQPGECVTLIGRNGMGKTTTVRTLMGMLAPLAGQVLVDGQPLAGQASWRVARAGIGLVPEGRQIFPNLSVRENLVATAGNRHRRSDPWTLDGVYAMFPRLQERERHLGANLSGGEQQMLAIGRALMTNPRLLILDEATEGLAPLIRTEIWSCLTRLRDTGLSMIVIDKHIGPMLRLADRHYILEKGRVVWQGDSEALRDQPAVLHQYLGV